MIVSKERDIKMKIINLLTKAVCCPRSVVFLWIATKLIANNEKLTSKYCIRGVLK